MRVHGCDMAGTQTNKRHDLVIDERFALRFQFNQAAMQFAALFTQGFMNGALFLQGFLNLDVLQVLKKTVGV